MLTKANTRSILPQKTTEGLQESTITHYVDIGYRFVKRMLEQNADYKMLQKSVPNFLESKFQKAYVEKLEEKMELKKQASGVKKEANESVNSSSVNGSMTDLMNDSCNLEDDWEAESEAKIFALHTNILFVNFTRFFNKDLGFSEDNLSSYIPNIVVSGFSENWLNDFERVEQVGKTEKSENAKNAENDKNAENAENAKNSKNAEKAENAEKQLIPTAELETEIQYCNLPEMMKEKQELKEWQLDMRSEDGYFAIYTMQKNNALEGIPSSQNVGYEGLQILGERIRNQDEDENDGGNEEMEEWLSKVRKLIVHCREKIEKIEKNRKNRKNRKKSKKSKKSIKYF